MSEEIPIKSLSVKLDIGSGNTRTWSQISGSSGKYLVSKTTDTMHFYLSDPILISLLLLVL